MAVNNDFKLCYSYKEAAEATSMSRTALWRLARDGRLEVVHVGSRAFITAESLKAVFGPVGKAA